jgi:beta-glucosidase
MNYEDTNFKEQAKALVAQMTLEEKAGLCSGQDCWTTKPINRLGLESISMMDGPHGLRKQIGKGDNLGIGDSVPAVCFPTASALACSFDRDLLHRIGEAIAEECLAEGVSLILGPGVNQKRNPLCGRNFEYFSEDPLVSGELAAAMIQGVQSKGIGTSLKHFAVNNQEKHRMTINAVVDERALREIYLKAFQIAVEKGKPDTVMCSYNRVNGEYASENKYLLTDILRKEWGFDGAVISDWGAVNDRVSGIKAGLDLEMPGNNGYNDKKVVRAVNEGALTMEELNRTACNVTELVLKGMHYRNKSWSCSKEEHHQLAVKAAEQSAVLLKNEESILPGTCKQKVLVIGTLAKNPRYQGAGSSKINPYKLDNPWDSFLKAGVDCTYAQGYSEKMIKGRSLTETEKAYRDRLLSDACNQAKEKDIVYIFAGLLEGYESEGFDRSNLSMPEEHCRLIEEVSRYNSNIVVILQGGAPMELPWLSKVKAVLLAYLGGEGGGSAIVNLLLGRAVPSGKLAETWPVRLEDIPSSRNFPGGRLTTEYRESIYVGYRYFDTAGVPVQFPFGHGLSYSSFTYSDMKLSKENCIYGDKITVSFTLTNTGEQSAREISFLFTSHHSEAVFLPKKELRAFVVTELESGESKNISVLLDTNTFGYYNTIIKDWYAESGEYKILLGGTSDSISLEAAIELKAPEAVQPDYRKKALSYYNVTKGFTEISKEEFEIIYGRYIPTDQIQAIRPFHMGNTLEDISGTMLGKLICWYSNKYAKEVSKAEAGQEGMMAAMIYEMPFFAIAASGEGGISENMLEGLIDILNRRFFRGIKKMLKKRDI